MVTNIEGGAYTECVWEYVVEEDIFVWEGQGNEEWKKVYNEELNDL